MKLFTSNYVKVGIVAGVLVGIAVGIAAGLIVMDRDCKDFQTRGEAQAFFEKAGAGDPHGLDRDKDGLACEWNRL